MTPFQKLLTSTAIIAFTALPAQALVLDQTATLGVYTAGMVPSDDVDDGTTGPASADGATSAPTANSTLSPDDPVFESTDDSTGADTGDQVASAPDANPTLSPDDPIFESTDDSTGPATGDQVASAPTPSAPSTPASVLIENSEFTADDVVDSTGARIGVVENVIRMDGDRTTLVVLANGGTPTEGRFTVTIDPNLTSDGVVQLYWSIEELNAALAAL